MSRTTIGIALLLASCAIALGTGTRSLAATDPPDPRDTSAPAITITTAPMKVTGASVPAPTRTGFRTFVGSAGSLATAPLATATPKTTILTASMSVSGTAIGTAPPTAPPPATPPATITTAPMSVTGN